MLDIGWSEMAVIMAVALIVIGPKDLPRLARTIGQWVRKGRSLAAEFQRSLDDMAREAELQDVKKEIERIGRTDLGKTIERSIDPHGEISKALDPTNPATPRNPADKPAVAAPASPPAANGAVPVPSPAAEPATAPAEVAPAAAEAEPAPSEPAKPEPAKPEPAKPEPAKPEPAKPEPAKPQPADLG
jgi:sec-independent protein translocase protein TatB